jgi:septal ring factor EnvC (AmiA/AmiB activator)
LSILFVDFAQVQNAVENLTTAFLTIFNTPVEAITHSLHELQQNQLSVLASVSSENTKMTSELETQYKDVFESFEQLPQYITKLQQMKKEMVALSTRITKLKQRSEKLEAKKVQRDQQLAEKQRKQVSSSRRSYTHSHTHTTRHIFTRFSLYQREFDRVILFMTA